MWEERGGMEGLIKGRVLIKENRQLKCPQIKRESPVAVESPGATAEKPASSEGVLIGQRRLHASTCTRL